MNADRNLLAGILALQNAFIDRHQLVAAFDRWIVDKSQSLLGILEAQGHLSAECRALLEALVEQHLKRHGDDPEKSLAALSSIGSARAPLAALADQDLDASLARVSAAHVSAAHVSAGGDAPGGIGDLFRQAGVRPAEGEAEGRFRPVPGCESTVEGGRFTILRAHAKGGLGQVSVALDGELNREVAFKEIQERYADDPGSRKRFLLEAEITGGLEHPGIVPVYGLGAYGDGRPYYANPQLGSDRKVQHRYNAACSAALAGSGKGREDPSSDAAVQAKLRGQALGWLKAEMATWTGSLESADEQQRAFIAATLKHWRQDPDLAGIRDAAHLEELPEDERAACTQLWADVAAFLKQAEVSPGNEREP